MVALMIAKRRDSNPEPKLQRTDWFRVGKPGSDTACRSKSMTQPLHTKLFRLLRMACMYS
jgi:hypothetical protein